MLVAVITVSDRASTGEYEDRSGPAAASVFAEAGFEVLPVAVVPDEEAPFREAVDAAIASGADVVFSTGGTGVAPRDQTPEFTAPLLEMRLAGVEEAIRARGLASTPYAAISRGVVGLTSRGSDAVLIANAPGSTGGARDGATVVAELADHILTQARGAQPHGAAH